MQNGPGGGELLSCPTVVSSPSWRRSIVVVVLRNKYAKFRLRKVAVSEAACSGLLFALSPTEVYWHSATHVPGMKTLLIQALMARNAVCQRGLFSEYWTERLAYRDGIRFRGVPERLGFWGRGLGIASPRKNGVVFALHHFVIT